MNCFNKEMFTNLMKISYEIAEVRTYEGYDRRYCMTKFLRRFINAV